ncbi:hypothetical protein AMS58_01335 [Pseudoalteromonas porphyrae]|uniref:hypothetical protein n=1 Tax=Pseudoalteromonas porphyrae TaxID=187330 RepID=UPI0006BB00C4|nr:hypothetical protein [Pseudoalteromonas porphyrae]KPH96237.1 hypothetical protein AMS58_01335 [Pseudoalteromonas porphyrae]
MSNSFKKFADKNIEELAEQMFGDFEKHTKAFELPHKITRRIAVYASILSILGFIYLIAKFDFLKSTKLYKIGDISVLESWWDSGVYNWLAVSGGLTLIIFVIVGVYFFFKNKPLFGTLKENLVSVVLAIFYILPIAAFLVFDWGDVLPLFFVFGVLIFISSYSINRKFGYTRAWSRNRTASQKVQVIYGQYKAGLTSELETIENLFALYELMKEQAHIDIVKDYEVYGNAALSWVKGLRK